MNGRKSVIVKLYDINNILFSRENQDKKTVTEWFIADNKDFFDSEVEKIQAINPGKVIFGNVTDDQDIYAYADSINTCKNEIRLGLLPLVSEYFSKFLSGETVLDPIWMADIYGMKKNGESFQGGLEESFQDDSKVKHSRAIADDSRVTHLLTQANRAVIYNPEANEIILDYFTTNTERFGELYDFFSAYGVLLDKKITLQLHLLNQNNPLAEHPRVDIKGKGTADETYEWGIRYLELQYENPPVNVKTITDLVEYCYSRANQQADVSGKFSITKESFKLEPYQRFYEDQIKSIHLKVTEADRHEPYKTTGMLVVDNLLPPTFLLPSLGADEKEDKLEEQNTGPIVLDISDESGEEESEENAFIIDEIKLPEKTKHKELKNVEKSSPQSRIEAKPQPTPKAKDMKHQIEETTLEIVGEADSSDNEDSDVAPAKEKENIEKAFATFSRISKNYSMKQTSLQDLIKLLRENPIISRMPPPEDFDAVQVITEIAKQDCWNHQGYSWRIMTGKTPEGIIDIRTQKPKTLAKLGEIINSRTGKWTIRQGMTGEFYNMITEFCAHDGPKEATVRYLTLAAFCKKFELPGKDFGVQCELPENDSHVSPSRHYA